MPLTYVPFDNSYRAAYRQVSRAARGLDVICTCGQLDADGEGRAQHLGDITTQTRRTMWLLDDIIGQAGATPQDLLQVQVFYRNTPGFDEPAYRDALSALLPREHQPVMMLTPIATFPKGVEVEVDAIAVAGSAVTRQTAQSASGCAMAVRDDDLVFGQFSANGATDATTTAMLADLEDCLAKLGASSEDVCKVRYYQSELGDEIGSDELLVAEAFGDAQPVYTRLPLALPATGSKQVRVEVVCVVGNDKTGKRHRRQRLYSGDHWSWPWHLPYAHGLQCGDYLFVAGVLPVNEAGQIVQPDDLEAQIPFVMQHLESLLADFGLGFEDVIKVNAYYVGTTDLETWARNVQARCNFYPQPGPASTGVEVTTLGIPGVMVTVDCLAMLL